MVDPGAWDDGCEGLSGEEELKSWARTKYQPVGLPTLSMKPYEVRTTRTLGAIALVFSAEVYRSKVFLVG